MAGAVDERRFFAMDIPRVVRPIVVLVVVTAAMGATAAVVQAKPYEQVRFDDQFSFVVDDYCGDLKVRIDVHDQGVVVGRVSGKSRLLRYTQSHHGGSTITNLATGL